MLCFVSHRVSRRKKGKAFQKGTAWICSKWVRYEQPLFTCGLRYWPDQPLPMYPGLAIAVSNRCSISPFSHSSASVSCRRIHSCASFRLASTIYSPQRTYTMSEGCMTFFRVNSVTPFSLKIRIYPWRLSFRSNAVTAFSSLTVGKTSFRFSSGRVGRDSIPALLHGNLNDALQGVYAASHLHISVQARQEEEAKKREAEK